MILIITIILIMIKMVNDDEQTNGWSVSSMTPLPGAAGENKKTTSMLNE